MQRQRGELVPIGDALGPVKSIRDDSPQARRGFTVADQVDRLVWASEAAPDRGFMARMMALCSLPRTNPRDRLRYVRRNGSYTLVMNAGRTLQAALRLPSALADGVDFDGGRAHSKPRVGSRDSLSISCGNSASTAATAKHTLGSATRWSASLTPVSG